jgi:hypothetical protein
MADQNTANPWDQAAQEFNSKPVSSTPAPTAVASDPWAQAAQQFSGRSEEAPASPTPAPQPISSDPWQQASAEVTGTGVPAPVQKVNEGGIVGTAKRAWDWANEPLIDINKTFDDENAPGWRKGVENVISGLTSPLSIALTIGTLGSGGLFESGAASSLRAAGLGAEEIADAAKGAQVIAKAARTGNDATQALKAAGISAETMAKATAALRDAGMGLGDLNTTGLLGRGGASALRGMGVGARSADTVAQGIQAMVDSGFTLQAAYQAAELSPRVLDALKDGDYDKAAELGVEALASGTFAGLGASSLAHHAGGLMDEASAKLGLKVKPTEENNAVRSNIGEYQRDVVQNDRAMELMAQDLRKKYSSLSDTDKEAVMYLMQAGGDAEKLAERHNLLAEAAGRENEIIPTAGRPGTEQGERAPQTAPMDPRSAFQHIRDGERFALISAEQTGLAPEENAQRNQALQAELEKMGYKPTPAVGKQDGAESKSFFVPDIPSADAAKLAKQFGQDSVFTREGLRNLKDDTVNPGVYDTMRPGKAALGAQDYTILQGPNGEQLAFTIPVDRSRTFSATRPRKVFHGTGAEGPLSVSDLDSATHAKTKGVGGIATYVSTDPTVASQYVANNEGGKVIGAVLRPDIRLLDARKALPEPVAKSMKSGFERLAHEYFPDRDPNELFREFQTATQSQVKSLSDPAVSYVEMIDATRRLLQDADKDVRKGLIEYQKNVAGHGYDGVENVYGDERPVTAIFPHEVTGRSVSELMKPATPFRDLTAEESKLFDPGPSGDEAEKMARYRELAREQRLKNTSNYTEAERDSMLKAYRQAINASPEMKALAKELREHFSGVFEKAHQKGVIKNAIENYISQVWDKDANHAGTQRLLTDADNGRFRTNVSHAQHRTFENAFEGQLLGKKLKYTDPIAIAAGYGSNVGKAIAARDFLERLRDKGIRASDGRPLVALSGTGNLVEGEGDPITFVNPKTIRSIRIANNVVDGLKQRGDLTRLIDEGKIVKHENANGEPSYSWATKDFRTIDHPAMRDWNYASQDSAGKPVLVNGELRVHPETFDYLNRFLGKDKSGIANSPLNPILKVGSQAKHLQLSLSPFHLAQEGLRAVMTGVNPFGIEKWDLRTDPILRHGVENGLTLGKDYRGMESYQEGLGSGHSKILDKIPVVRELNNSMQHFLFDKYIPSLKSRAYKSLFDKYRSSYPDWSADKVAQEAAAATNERFGGINYQQIGRAAGTQDFLRLTTLAPDWLESELRFIGRLAGGDKVALGDTAKFAAILWSTARVLNYLTSGKPHFEAPFGVATQQNGKEKIYSVRTLPTDVLHAVSDPTGFIRGRLSPVLRTGAEVYSGRDYLGRKMTPSQTAVDIAQGLLPIPVQSIAKQAQGQAGADSTNTDQAAKALGLSVFNYRTEAAKKAIELASSRNESGPVDPAKLRRHQQMLAIEDSLRHGEIKPEDVFQAVESGSLSLKEGKQVMEAQKETHQMDPELANLYTRAKRLPLRDFMQVWALADNNEKGAIAPLLLKKKQAYMKKAIKEMTPQERAEDPTYNQMRSMFPNQTPW